jgi:hypothetical protein
MALELPGGWSIRPSKSNHDRPDPLQIALFAYAKSLRPAGRLAGWAAAAILAAALPGGTAAAQTVPKPATRSEERRVGKECR